MSDKFQIHKANINCSNFSVEWNVEAESFLIELKYQNHNFLFHYADSLAELYTIFVHLINNKDMPIKIEKNFKQAREWNGKLEWLLNPIILN